MKKDKFRALHELEVQAAEILKEKNEPKEEVKEEPKKEGKKKNGRKFII